MANHTNHLDQIHFTLYADNETSIRESLLYIFDGDLDFTENEEQFRKNTIKKGYINEAHRIVVEYMKKNKVETYKQITKAVEFMADKLFASSFYEDYTVSVNEISNKVFSIAISYCY